MIWARRPLEVLRPNATTLRQYGALLLGVGSAIGLGAYLIRNYPLDEWLFVDLAVIWGWNILLTLAVGSAGWWALGFFVKEDELSPLGRLGLAFALGLVIFVLLMYLAGYIGIYGRAA